MSQHTDDYVCEECGMDFGAHGPEQLVERSSRFAERWRELADGAADAALRRRPDPQVWSALEYAGHLRDGLAWMAGALDRTREEDQPFVEWIGHEQRVAEAGDASRAVGDVTAELEQATRAFTAALVRTGDWGRTADYPWGVRDALDMGRNGVHEGVHHLHDVSRVLDRVR